jgi:peptidoglycan/LPS O-acetylase OafA/YrhL
VTVKNIQNLDGIRAISVIIVLISHAGLGKIIPGGLGVTIFFFLSGFLITTLLNNEFELNNNINYKNFFIRRFCRLFPPLLITIFVSYSLAYTGILKQNYSFLGLTSQIFYLANYHAIFNWPGEIPDGLGILWSLAVEEHFYFVFPLLLYTCFKFVGKGNTALILVFSCVLVLLWRCYLIFIEGSPSVRTYYATDTRIDSILYGCILALIYNPILQRKEQFLKSKDFLILGICLIVMLFSLLFRSEWFRETFRYSIQGIALMPIFYYCIKYNKSIVFNWLENSWLKRIGIFSYSIYLIHHVIIEGLKFHGLENIGYIICITFILSTLFAFLIDKFIDSYFIKIRKKYR